jgi:hypothetical protein
MDTKQTYYWAIVGVAALAVLGIVFVFGNYLARDASFVPQEVGKKTEESGAKARLVIDFGNGTKRVFRGDVAEGMTVYDALLASQEVGGLSFSLNGEEVNEIGGVKNNSHEWRYYVNGKSAKTAPQFEEVKPGYEIVFRFE